VNLEEILGALHAAGVEFVIIGGAAMRFQGSARLTEDIDFCYSRSKRNIEALANALAPFHPRLRGAPEGLPFHFDAATTGFGSNFTLLTDLGPLNFLGHVPGLGDYEAVVKESETIEVFGINQKVLSLGGLIKSKKAAARSKDVEAIKELEAMQEYRKRTGLK
jgi:predicted nucleotidyltransferase